MNLPALIRLAEDLNHEILIFCIAAIATFVILLIYDAKNNLPGFVHLN